MKSDSKYWTNPQLYRFYLSNFSVRISYIKMAKLREISSIEHGLTEAIKNLKSKVIEEVTGKSESFLRKCSDPDLDQQLDHRDAVKIDKACVQKGLTPYLLRAHEYIIQKELKNVVTDQKDLNELLTKFTILHGQLLSVINSAKSSSGHKGEQISSVEKKDIFEAFEALENKIHKIKTTIESS